MKHNRTNLTVRLSPRERELLTGFRESYELETDSQALRKLIRDAATEEGKGACTHPPESLIGFMFFTDDGPAQGRVVLFVDDTPTVVAWCHKCGAIKTGDEWLVTRRMT